MTEAEWLTCRDPDGMLAHLAKAKYRFSPRRGRLFACHCCRRIWPLLEEAARGAVEAAEWFADGRILREDLIAARDRAIRANRNRFEQVGPVLRPRQESAGQWAVARTAWEAGEAASRTGTALPGAAATLARTAAALADPLGLRPEVPAAAESPAQAALLRDLVGNPFRPTPGVDPAWLGWSGGTVAALAETIYEEDAFDRLPILADALEEAGCGDVALLKHLRGPGEHARGCWALDLLLGKA